MSLVGTGDIRTWIKVSDADKTPNVKFEALINAIEGYIEQYTNRKLEAQLFKTMPDYCYFDGTGIDTMWTPVFPIWRVDELVIDSDRVFTDSGSLVSTNGENLIIYPSEGKIVLDTSSGFGIFTRGRRNVRLAYYAGYGAGSYPVPSDLKQVIVEMVVASFNEGITGVHTVVGPQESKFIKMLSKNTYWSNVINSYKNYAIIAGLNVGVY